MPQYPPIIRYSHAHVYSYTCTCTRTVLEHACLCGHARARVHLCAHWCHATCVRDSSGLLPNAEDSIIKRIRLDWPPAMQLPRQSPHGAHAVNEQSTGQPCVAHSASSIVAAQPWPPFADSCTTARIRDVLPVPQLMGQGAHDDHGVIVQSKGQVDAKHGRVSAKIDGQASPAPSGGAVIDRNRDAVPWLHDTEHLLHPLQSST